uniref:Putative Rod shape-determining protein MreD n=1 Tax=Magnetococcus massalia (strain MO-1) TaxID=451514 RepID=A0A1S7LEJ9_MAGMO|nr:putative Rod shape-determining protein MreD [Candidatus Magnetococcus massalia]
MTVVGALLKPWIPAVTLFLAIALQEVALPMHAWTVLRPDLLLIALFYWRLYRPDLCGPTVIFVSGLTVDILSGGLLGLNALSKSLLLLPIREFGNRLRGSDSLFLLPIVAILCLMDQGVQMLFATLVQGWGVDWMVIAGRAVASALVAPLVVAALIHTHRSWLEEASRAGR